jgi:hypothetical protein
MRHSAVADVTNFTNGLETIRLSNVGAQFGQ